MRHYLLTLSLGPVQSLIADARRTRDLWCGSWLLSEAARAAARVLHTRHPGCLIFPFVEDPRRALKPQCSSRGQANFANVLRAQVRLLDEIAVRRLCDDAQRAAGARVQEIGEQALAALTHPIRRDVWNTQIKDILESFAAWVDITDGTRDYGEASRQLGAVLNARKATRDFAACPPLRNGGLPKSSLDGARETILHRLRAQHPDRSRLGLSPGEQLDALGVTKRLAGEVGQFTAWPRIAADSWIESLTREQQRRLGQVYESLLEIGLSTRVRGNQGIYKALPFDGHLLFAERLDSVLDPTQPWHRRLVAFRECLQEIARQRSRTGGRVGAPVPYAAILKADGDRMGQLLGHAENAEQSRDISRALYEFATEAVGIVRTHRGHAIYAGGDDVLALLPLSGALECACDLAGTFARRLGRVASRMELSASVHPTLSVGIGIGHIIEPLGALRARADRAEHHAKGDGLALSRNALAIHLGIRSGGELTWRSQWSDHDGLQALHRFIGSYRKGALSSRVAYELRAAVKRLPLLDVEGDPTARGMQMAAVSRLLDRARTKGAGGVMPREMRAFILERLEYQSLMNLANTMILARWLAGRGGDGAEETP